MRDLFGEPVLTGVDQDGEVALSLVVHGESVKAWRLGESLDVREAHWVPKSQVRRGHGRDENVWTMPVWLARERGWL